MLLSCVWGGGAVLHQAMRGAMWKIVEDSLEKTLARALTIGGRHERERFAGVHPGGDHRGKG